MNRFCWVPLDNVWMVSVGLVLEIVALGVTASAIAGETPLPSHEELVKETVTLIRQLDESSRIRMLIQLAALEGRLGEKEMAHSLFLETTQTLTQASHAEWFLEKLVRAEREVGDHAALDETLPVALSLIERTTKDNSNNSSEAERAEYYRFERLLKEADLYAIAGKLDRAKDLVHEVVQALPRLTRSDQGAQEQEEGSGLVIRH